MRPACATSPTSNASRPQLKNVIYGIEPGNDGNRLVLGMIKQNLFDLGDFKLIESSEQGMLAEVERAIHDHEPIVFLAWDPHPMNMRFDLRYLTGGDSVFGPNFGGATVYTNTRAGYVQDCPNIGRLLKNLKFTLTRRKPDDGRHPESAPAARRGRGGLVEGQSQGGERAGSRA